jgi:hypothetical protein
VKPEISADGSKASTSTFFILVVTLWCLNIADLSQTLYLKHAGLLGEEVNKFIQLFLDESSRAFIAAKLLALILITSILLRGWFDQSGVKTYGVKYSMEQVRRTINLMLTTGVIYYVLIVGFPFIGMLMSGYFNP